MKREKSSVDFSQWPMKPLTMGGGSVMEILIPRAEKQRVLEQIYPFPGVPQLDEVRMDSVVNRAFWVRDYKVIFAGGIHYLASPYYAQGGGCVDAWMRPRRRTVERTVNSVPQQNRWGVRIVAFVGVALVGCLLMGAIWTEHRWGVDAEGIVTRREVVASRAMLRKWSLQGNARASYELARRLEAGHSLKRNASAAGHMYLIAEEQGITLPEEVIERMGL